MQFSRKCSAHNYIFPKFPPIFLQQNLHTYYSKNYASILCQCLVLHTGHHTCTCTIPQISESMPNPLDSDM